MQYSKKQKSGQDDSSREIASGLSQTDFSDETLRRELEKRGYNITSRKEKGTTAETGKMG